MAGKEPSGSPPSYQDWGSIRDVPGVRAGHATRADGHALTGVTVVIPPPGTVGSVDVRGGGPGTHETDALHPASLVPTVDAVVLTGGSAFGLASARGVQNWCVEQGLGFAAGPAHDPSSILVPIVPAAAVFDLHGQSPGCWPDAEMGYAAAVSAAGNTGKLVAGIGAGIGCRVAARTLPGGCGSASRTLTSTIPGIDVPGGIVVGALAVVNAAGTPFTAAHGYYARPFLPPGLELADPSLELHPGVTLEAGSTAPARPAGPSNTTLVVIATNAKLDPGQCFRTAVAGQDGIARALVPAHTMVDGDTVFALATGEIEIDLPALIQLQALAATVALLAITDAMRRTAATWYGTEILGAAPRRRTAGG